MKTITTFICFITLLPTLLAQTKFNKWFCDKTVRINYIIAGNNSSCQAYLSKYIITDQWAGRRKNLDTYINNGCMLLEIRDLETDSIIYVQPYNTLFNEWQTTEEAKKINRAFRECITFPQPLKKCKINLYKRNKENKFSILTSLDYNPNDNSINKEKKQDENIVKILESGSYKDKIDIVFLPEGYTQNEMPIFINKAKQFTQILFNVNPYAENRNKFNVTAVAIASPESGVDNPNINTWVKTNLDFTYNTFNMDRYLTSENQWAICDLAQTTTYEHIIVLANSKKYGGGGIYNYYSVFAADNIYSQVVMAHEFGHAFAGLADEYEGDVTYNDYQNMQYEPIEPNLTILKDFDSKWKNLVDPHTPIPTPTKGYENKIGAFEGGGYAKKGIYRPQLHCMMHDNETKYYCKICYNAVENTIKFYSE